MVLREYKLDLRIQGNNGVFRFKCNSYNWDCLEHRFMCFFSCNNDERGVNTGVTVANVVFTKRRNLKSGDSKNMHSFMKSNICKLSMVTGYAIGLFTLAGGMFSA